jgi:UDP-N-acetylmuramoylalanine--D-glutamate ligase
MKIAILGFGREGKAVRKFLKKRKKTASISILDRKTDPDYLKKLIRFDLIFRSPGVPYNLPEVQEAIRNGVKFSSATALFFEETERKKIAVIGITGTKGKGTTSTLLYKMLKSDPKYKNRVFLAGNIGKPAIDLLSKLNRKSMVIFELSSFQLQDLKYSPATAVMLDVFPDHLDSHQNLKEYLEAKSNISRHQKKTDRIFYISGNKYSEQIAEKSKGRKIKINPSSANIFLAENDLAEIKSRIKIPGKHNYKNAVMAAAIAASLDLPKKSIFKTIADFRGTKYRLELIRTAGNIEFYNDSASTNPETAATAVRAFSEPKILIAGGKDKNLDYAPLARALKNSNTKLVVLFGENKNKIKLALRVLSAPIKFAKTLKEAAGLALAGAKEEKARCAIIFSPAAASFDMFKNYVDRGKKFNDIVKTLR